MKTEIRNKQDAYNAYAAAMEEHASYARAGDDGMSNYWWEEAQGLWDLYFYWDEEIDQETHFQRRSR